MNSTNRSPASSPMPGRACGCWRSKMPTPRDLRDILEAIARDDRHAPLPVISQSRCPAAPPRGVDPRSRGRGRCRPGSADIVRGRVSRRSACTSGRSSIGGCSTIGVQDPDPAVTVNLISNAVHALEHRAATDRRLQLTLRPVEPGRLEMSVRDNGTGIPSDRLPQIFEPYFQHEE